MYIIEVSRLVPINGEHGGWITQIGPLVYEDGMPMSESDARAMLEHTKNKFGNTPFIFRLVQVTTKIIA